MLKLSLPVCLQSFASEMNNLVALHELYKYINKYYDQVVHTHTHTHNACAFTDEKHRLCSTPSPWGRGPSNTDVALINWAQRREVGLETTWQFPAAYPPPPPSLPKTPPLLLKFGSRKSAGGLLGGVSAVWR